MIEVYIDGASAGNPGPSGAGIIIKGNGEHHRYSIPLQAMNNHEAEFHALIKALELCLEKQYTMVSFRTDSQIVDTAMNREYVKNKAFLPLLEKALTLSKQIDLFFIKWVPSSENSGADQLAREAIHQKEAGL
ncbi:ribonuclease HI [Priestia aryabhattai]|uniref:RNase H family protein n=1 Tax=Bacillaceae TaxID=186817 RepID=UPI000BA01A99|nr:MULTISPECIES: RNase H family protein [Bacillaceae]MDT2047382.1 reverse transcriptase-like protein [Priestia flexa]OZT14063.1 ribonuclease HI [Priestia aryabhattai]TDB55127.1 reverse transcriptase-like protein [Bacillus sp. CBEL-1]USY56490.1 reverse transcriptase-like protein [Bacillus sp. 1780r2a1]